MHIVFIIYLRHIHQISNNLYVVLVSQIPPCFFQLRAKSSILEQQFKLISFSMILIMLMSVNASLIKNKIRIFNSSERNGCLKWITPVSLCPSQGQALKTKVSGLAKVWKPRTYQVLISQRWLKIFKEKTNHMFSWNKVPTLLYILDLFIIEVWELESKWRSLWESTFFRNYFFSRYETEVYYGGYSYSIWWLIIQ